MARKTGAPGTGIEITPAGAAERVVALASNIASSVRVCAPIVDARWGTMIVCSDLSDGESGNAEVIVVQPCAKAVVGELVRIDDRLLNDHSLRLKLRDLIVREIEPFIIGVGDVRVVFHEGLNCLVVVADVPRDVITPEMVEAGAKAYWSYDDRFEGLDVAIARIWRSMEEARVRWRASERQL